MKRLTTLALVLGLCTAIGLFVSSGIGDVAAAFVSAGWGAIVVIALRGFAVAWAGLGWFVVFPSRDRPPFGECVSLRFVREGINTLLPVAAVGGDFIAARLLAKRGLAGGLAGASVLVDLMVQALTQFLFTIVGVLLVVRLVGDGPIVHAVEGGLAIAAPALLAFYVVQRRGGHRVIEAVLKRFASGKEWRPLGAVNVLYASLRRLYGNGARIGLAILIHSIGWVIGTLEVWVCLHAMGYPVSVAEALVIESLAQAVRGAAFAVPGAIGAQEGGLIALCALFGIPAEAALALSLVKRIADLAVGVPSLFLWHRIERLLAEQPAPAGEAQPGRDPVPRVIRPASIQSAPIQPAPIQPASCGLAVANLPSGHAPSVDTVRGELKKCA